MNRNFLFVTLGLLIGQLAMGASLGQPVAAQIADRPSEPDRPIFLPIALKEAGQPLLTNGAPDETAAVSPTAESLLMPPLLFDPAATGGSASVQAAALSVGDCRNPTAADARQPLPQANDETFVVDQGAGLDTGCVCGGASLVINIPVTRYVAPVDRGIGSTPERSPLIAPDVLVANGVMAPMAKLQIAAWDVDSAANPGGYPVEVNKVYFNGTEITGTLQGKTTPGPAIASLKYRLN